MDKKRKMRSHGIFFSNITLVQGILLAPIVVAATTFYNALGITVAFSVITFFSVFISSFLGKGLPYVLRLIIHILIASILFIPSAMLVEWLMPGSQENLGIYLPLLITNSIVVHIGGTNAENVRLIVLCKRLLKTIVGFGWVICLVGIVREWLSYGSFWQIKLSTPWIPVAVYPFAGFILLGFLAAGVNGLRLYRGHFKEDV